MGILRNANRRSIDGFKLERSNLKNNEEWTFTQPLFRDQLGVYTVICEILVFFRSCLDQVWNVHRSILSSDTVGFNALDFHSITEISGKIILVLKLLHTSV